MNAEPQTLAIRAGEQRPGGRFHHVGFVVASIAPVIENFCRALDGKSWSETWHDPVQNVWVAFIYPQKQSDPSLELVEPAGPGSPVQDFLASGGGLHHVCYEVDDLDRTVREARGHGLVMIRRPQPAVAFGGRRIAWFVSREKLLIEYLEGTTKP
jgi:methylmalonyl-CoA/ethylmalonyl-CoA epimerase